MFCTQCGTALEEKHLYCFNCGKPAKAGLKPAAAPRSEKRFERLMNEKKIAGVCAGVARYLSLDVTLVRVIWLLMFLVAGTGLLAYIVCWIIMPKEYEPAPPVATQTAVPSS